MSHLSKNIKAIRTALGLTQSEFAVRLGSNRGALAQWELGSNKPGAKPMMELCKISNATMQQLEAKTLQFESGANSTVHIAGTGTGAKASGKKNNADGGVPVYNVEATAGNMQLTGDLPEVVQGYINLPNFKDCVAFLYIRGDSMYPKLKAGDLVGIMPIKDLEIIQYGQVYLIITKDNQRMVKIIRKGKDDFIILRSENANYDDIEIHRNKIVRLFIVKGPIRDDWQ